MTERMVSHRSLICCFGLFILVTHTPASTLETKGTPSGILRHWKQFSPRRGILRRQKRSTAFATIRVINKTGREVNIAYMNHYRSPHLYTALRRNEKKSFKSRIYTTWYAYHNSFSNYVLMNGKSRFLVLRKHTRRITDVVIQRRDNTKPSIIPRKYPEKYIELMVIADSTMYEKYKENTEKYVLTIVNQGRRHFQDPSFGDIKLNVIVTRVKIIKKKENDFKIKANAPRQNMVSACNFAAGFNVPSDYDDRHFDFSVIFTRRKFGYSGYTPMFQMCKTSYSCTLMNDKGLALAHVFAHEIAHSLGVDHDGEHNNCTVDGLKGSLMGKILYSRLDKYYWSRCSREQLMQTLGYFHCLNDKPRINITRYMSKLPGVVMSRDEQCKMRYVKHYIACRKYIHPYYECKGTYCAPDWDAKNCLYYSRPPLDGSKCNNGNGWCIKGTCYPHGRLTFYPIDGGWSNWQAWGECSASCGIGIRYRTRKCDKPRPKHEGKECSGGAKEIMACMIKKCPIAETVTDVRSKYCRSLKSEKWSWFTQSRAYEIASTIDGINCTFENNCSWTESLSDEFNWTRNSGRTPSHGTGPSEDHTFQNKSGHYLFIEASTGDGDDLRKQGFRAHLVSPLIRLPEACLTFYYHMLGSHLGSLSVYKRTDEGDQLLWKRTEEIGDTWHKGEVNITNPIAFKIYFEAVRGRHYQGDIAIDDIELAPGKCSSLKQIVTNPCLISCTNGNETTFLENITLPDTYRCHADDRLDICIAGKCEKLGCDLKLGSNKTTDRCKICDGDNSKCTLSEKQLVIKLNSSNETTLLDIPQNSTGIYIEVVAVSYDVVGIKSRDTVTHFPARTVKSDIYSEYVLIHGQTFNFAFKFGVVVIRSDGPSNVPIQVVIAPSGEPEAELKYQMFVPKVSREPH